MIIEKAEKKDCEVVANIHFEEINQGFLNTLGKKFLRLFYEFMTVSPNAFLIVARNEDEVVGFISGCTNLKEFYKEFFNNYKIRSFFILFKKIFNFSIIKKIWETIKYSKKDDPELPQAELLSMAVKREFQGRGVAQDLLNLLVAEMEKRGIKSFKVITGENLVSANKFYQKSGFKFHSKIFVHKNSPSNTYIYKTK